MLFFLGTHMPNWLAQTDVPLCVSRRRLAPYKQLPRAKGRWMLDSGGFSELSLSGGWQTEPRQYVAEVRRFAAEIGGLEAAACQDWMCEPGMLLKTGLGIAEHQQRTVVSYLDLRLREPSLPWFPVLQGWQPDDYLRHAELYARAGIELASLPLVGVGSVCRRQHTGALEGVLDALAPLRLRLHGFGIKRQGLERVSGLLASADSMAWSLHARNREAMAGCAHRSCSSCLRYALAWAEQVRAEVAAVRWRQMRMAL